MTNNIIEIDGKKYQLVEVKEEPKPRKTGYEKTEENSCYYHDSGYGRVVKYIQMREWDDEAYKSANYYTDEQLAKNNMRADTLMRNLRRFSVEGRKQRLDWANSEQKKFYIYFHNNRISTDWIAGYQSYGTIYFDIEELAETAIEKYRDELMWYFTEYSDTAEVFDE